MSDEDIDRRLKRIKDFLEASNQKKREFYAFEPPSPPAPLSFNLPPSFNLACHTSLPSTSSSIKSEEEEEEMAHPPPEERTLKELMAPDLDQQPLCITYPTLEVNFELKSGLIHLLPTFHGFAGEDPNKHLKEFHVVCSSMKPIGIFEE